MKTCKFCQMPEGAPGGRTGVLHINRDGLCGPCATLLDKVKYQPDKLDKETMEQFEANCRWNLAHGLFVPVAQRRSLRDTTWRCKACGRPEGNEVVRANGYTNYCVVCAETIRSESRRGMHYRKKQKPTKE